MEVEQGAGRVLVVDSDPYRRVFLVQMLMELGRRVLMAGTAAEAHAILSSLGGRVGAVMISPQLTDSSGHHLARTLVADDAGRRVILVGGEPSETLPAGVRSLARPLTRDKLSALFADLPN